MDQLTPQLAGTGQLGLVCVEFLRQCREGANACAAVQALINVDNRARYFREDSRKLAELRKGPISKPFHLGKTARNLAIDINKRRDGVTTFVTNHYRVSDHEGRAQVVLNELWWIALAPREAAHILHPIKEDKLAALIDAHGI